MSNRITANGESAPQSPQLADYMGGGKCFLESCRAYLDDLHREDDPDDRRGEARRELAALREVLELLRQPDRDIDSGIAAIWLPRSFDEKERRYRNFRLWSDFASGQYRSESRCPALSEKALLKALQAGHNDFECKHHLFNLLVSAGFPRKLACLLAKYLGHRVTN